MENFDGKIAVITGGGTGMGRELTYQLAAEGCHVSICDVIEENMVTSIFSSMTSQIETLQPSAAN